MIEIIIIYKIQYILTTLAIIAVNLCKLVLQILLIMKIQRLITKIYKMILQ
jgi:hypothetical protein